MKGLFTQETGTEELKKICRGGLSLFTAEFAYTGNRYREADKNHLETGVESHCSDGLVYTGNGKRRVDKNIFSK